MKTIVHKVIDLYIFIQNPSAGQPSCICSSTLNDGSSFSHQKNIAHDAVVGVNGPKLHDGEVIGKHIKNQIGEQIVFLQRIQLTLRIRATSRTMSIKPFAKAIGRNVKGL